MSSVEEDHANALLYAHVSNYVQRLLQRSPIYGHLFQKIRLVQASPVQVVASLKVEGMLLNSMKSLHGSVSATLVDFMGGVVIAASKLAQNLAGVFEEGLVSTGVSADMHISFIGGASEGDELVATGNIQKLGGSLAFTTVEISKISPGMSERKPVAMGSHTKYVRERR